MVDVDTFQVDESSILMHVVDQLKKTKMNICFIKKIKKSSKKEKQSYNNKYHHDDNLDRFFVDYL